MFLGSFLEVKHELTILFLDIVTVEPYFTGNMTSTFDDDNNSNDNYDMSSVND